MRSLATFSVAALAVVFSLLPKPCDHMRSEEEREAHLSKSAGNRLATAIIRTETCFGSGAVISPDGFLLTNYHVVADAVQQAAVFAKTPDVEVVLPEEIDFEVRTRSYPAIVYRVDPVKDLALVKVTLPFEVPSLPYYSLASRPFQVEDRCVVVGSPSGGLAWSVRFGRINAISRFPRGLTEHQLGLWCSAGDRMDAVVVQSDCSISEGDSGGPLLDTHGRLAGLTFATTANLSVGSMGYHVGLEEIRAFVEDLPREPEGIPFDPWTAGVGDDAPTPLRVLDLDGNGQDDTLVCANYDVMTGEAAAVTFYVDCNGAFADSDQNGDLFPRGVWDPKTAHHLRYDVFMVVRQDGTHVVGYTDANGAITEMRIDWDGDGTAEVSWRHRGSGWEMSRDYAPVIDHHALPRGRWDLVTKAWDRLSKPAGL